MEIRSLQTHFPRAAIRLRAIPHKASSCGGVFPEDMAKKKKKNNPLDDRTRRRDTGGGCFKAAPDEGCRRV